MKRHGRGIPDKEFTVKERTFEICKQERKQMQGTAAKGEGLRKVGAS